MPVPSSLTSIERLAAALQLDSDVAGAGVERVLDQLLDDGRRALDDLARRDLVGDGIGQDGNAAWHPGNLPADCRDRVCRHPALGATRTNQHPAPISSHHPHRGAGLEWTHGGGAAMR